MISTILPEVDIKIVKIAIRGAHDNDIFNSIIHEWRPPENRNGCLMREIGMEDGLIYNYINDIFIIINLSTTFFASRRFRLAAPG